MTPETLEALKASIAKWERNAVAETPEDFTIGIFECPLCDAFNQYRTECDGCPVKLATGRPYCHGSPYSKAASARTNWRFNEALDSEAHEAARAEVAFLKSLLPPDEAKP